MKKASVILASILTLLLVLLTTTSTNADRLNLPRPELLSSALIQVQVISEQYEWDASYDASVVPPDCFPTDCAIISAWTPLPEYAEPHSLTFIWVEREQGSVTLQLELVPDADGSTNPYIVLAIPPGRPPTSLELRVDGYTDIID